IGGTEARDLLRKALGSTNPYPVPAQAHHIFPVELFETPLGGRLHAWGIDLNSVENGVLLPSKRFPGWEGAIHKGGQPAYYNRAVRELLEKATTKEKALDAL